MGMIDTLARYYRLGLGLPEQHARQPVRSSGFPSLSFQDYVNWVTSGTSRFPTGSLAFNQEQMAADFVGYVSGAYASNGIVFACELARFSLFSEARFQFRRRVNGVPGEMFGTAALDELERPMPGQTTGDLLTRMLVHADLGGNAFPVRTQVGIRCIRPDWTTMVMGSRSDPAATPADVDAELVGLVYTPGGRNSGNKPIVYLPGDFAHFAPIPDPLVPYSGMPWIMPIVREVMADQATTTLKLRFFENGATPNLVVTFDPSVQPSEYDAWVDAFEAKNKGATNAWKTVYLGGGTTLTAVGKDFQQVDYKVVQGAGETRIAAAAGVPPVIAGFSEGLAAATYSNYGQARRRFADLTMRPLWRNAAGSLVSLIAVPPGAELWYDDRDIPFLQEDMKDEAVIVQTQSNAIRTLVDGGYTPESAASAVISGNLALLKHTGLYSVQLQPPGTTTSQPTEDPARALALAVLARSEQREQVVIHNHQPPVTVEAGDVHIAPGSVTVENRVEPTPVTVENRVEPTPGSNPWTEVIEGSYTAAELLRIMSAALAGELSGAGTTTIVIKGVDGATDRVTATVTTEGNRTAVALDGA